MKDSAWYSKIWRKKLAELPLKKDAGSAWAGMKNMLDAQMPVNSSNITPGKHLAAKSLVTKVVALLVYVLPAAAMIGTAVYFTVPILTKQKNFQLKKKQTNHLPADTTHTNQFVSLKPDSLNSIDPDTSKNSSLLKMDSIGKITANKTAEEQANTSKTSSKGAVSPWTVSLKATAGRSGGSKSALPLLIGNTPLISQNHLESTGMGSAQTLTAQGSPLLQRDNVTRALLLSGKSGSVTSKSPKSSNQKSKTKKSSAAEMTTPLFNYGIEAGLNKGNTSGLYVGAFGTYRIKTRWLLNAGIRIVSSEVVSGSYTSPAIYYFPDSLQPFKVTDKRKLLVLNVPLTIEYRLSKMISLNLGPVISFPVKQSNSYQLGPLINQMDTVSSKRLSVDTVLKRTIMNKINVGVTGGLSIHISQFYFDVRYQQNLTPYKVSSDFGSYQQYNRSLQLGIRYKFKK